MLLDPTEIDLIVAIITGLTLFGFLFFFMGMSLGRAGARVSRLEGLVQGFLASRGKSSGDTDESELRASV